ncbi:MAG: shikimate dehydrogenase [Alphaproteobacteria bacterium PA4]|nr:MAG: shikimate dehydrogenase [Alphaproteobacteria bacterium PA4]
MIPYAEVIGDPIAQSKSPLIHKFWLDKLGIPGTYRATRVSPDALPAYLAERRADPAWRGCNATIPHKQAALPLLDAVLGSAARVGAANCLYRAPGGLIGENSDVEGVAEALDLPEREPGVTCLIGAGGAARAALFALDRAGVRDLRLIVRQPAKGEALLAEFGMAGRVFGFIDSDVALRLADTVINASPLGMLAQPAMPRDVLDALALTAADALVFDMVYAPLETGLLAAARALGRQPVDGLTMLIGQADLAFQLFFKAAAPRHHDAELRALLTA